MYEHKVKEGQGSDSEMIRLSWEIEELKNVTEEIRKLHPNIDTIIEHLKVPGFNLNKNNIPRQFGNIRDALVKIVRRIFRFKRTAATYVIVVMISSELRNHKPYALPIQCLP